MVAVAFKKMWEDVNSLMTNKNVELEVINVFNSGFVIKEDNETVFITKDHFVDFWCNILYYNKISKDQISREKGRYMNYVYDIVKHLPYVSENSNELTLIG